MIAIRREHVPALTGLLTLASLALVFGAVGGAIPRSVVPTPSRRFIDLIPHLNAAISLAAIGTIAYGWLRIRRGDVERHRTAMLASLVLFASFLGFYLYRLVALGGPTSFGGPAAVERYVYLPILAVHILLAVVCIPLLYYVLLLALSRPVAALRRTRHAAAGRIAASLWLVSFALGAVVYLLLHFLYG